MNRYRALPRRNLSPRRRLQRAATAWLLASLFPLAAARAADPFYEMLMVDGIAAHQSGDFASSAEDLQIACFGLLEQPVILVECLAYLAVAQAEVGDVPGFTRTFGQILTAERVTGAFSSLELPVEVRSAFELRVEEGIPVETLDRAPVFHEIARRKRMAKIRSLPPDEALVELERLVIGEPDYLPWRVLLAEATLSTGDPAAALAAAETVLASASGAPAARCVRGKANAALGDCPLAFEDLDACEGSEATSRLVEIRVRCQIDLEAWDAAALLLTGLAAEERQAAPFRQLGKQIRRGQRSAPVTPEADPLIDDEASEPSATEAVAEESGATLPDALTPESAGGSAPGSEAQAETPAASGAHVPPELGGVRSLLAGGTRRQLELALTEARELADQHPQLAEPRVLMAEIAYRLSRWGEAVVHYERARSLTALGPEHQFYLAVALYESGRLDEAREILRLCLDRLEPTDFVTRYSQKINAETGDAN